MKVKILELYEHCDRHPDAYDYYYTKDDETNWEEVTEEDFKVLRDWARDNNAQSRNIHYVIVTERQISAKQTVADYLAQYQLKKKAAADKIKKQQAKENKRLATLEKRKADKEKRLLEQLKEKYGNTI